MIPAPATNKAKIDYLLSGKLFCGECGGAMVGQSSGNHTTYGYYECSTKKRVRTCNKKNVKKELIEDAVLKCTLDMLFSGETYNHLIELLKPDLDESESSKKILKSIKERQKRNQTEIDNVMNAIKMGIITQSTKEALKQLEQEQESLKAQLYDAEFLQSPVDYEQSVSLWLEQFKHGDINDIGFCKTIISILVNSVFVYDDGTVIITYNLGENNKHTIRLSDLDGVGLSAPCRVFITILNIP